MNEAMAITDASLVPVVPTAPDPSATALLVIGLAGLATRKSWRR